MKKYLFILILLCLPANFCFSQQSIDPFQTKYWYYRYRLVNDFMVRGTAECGSASGYSIPAPQIAVTDIDNKTKIKSYTNIKWSDATSYLGYYIGVLATEYSLLRQNQQPVDQTLDELRDAMMAYERLDRSAEKLYPPYQGDCTVNGYFCRDDVGSNLITDNPAFNKKYNFTSVNGLTVQPYSSDYKNNGGYPSQDQVSYLFMGFALVNKCLAGVSYNGYDFCYNAKQYTKAILGWIEKCNWHSTLPDGSSYDGYFNSGCQWGIAKAAKTITGEKFDDNEVGNEIIDDIPKINIPFDVTPIAIAAWEDIGDVFEPPSNFYINTAKDHNLSIPTGLNSLGETILAIMYTHAKDYSTSLIQSYAAVGSSWKYGLIANCKTVKISSPVGIAIGATTGLWGAAKGTNVKVCGYSLTFPNSTIPIPVTLAVLPEGINPDMLTVDMTELALAKYGFDFHQEIYYLLHRYLHHKTSDPIIGAPTYFDIMASAPCDLPCYEPYYDPAGRLQSSEGTEGWWACNKWVDPQTAFRQTTFMGKPIIGGTPAPFYHYGIFTGLDYMLLHNLYNLTFDPISPMQSTLEKTITTPVKSNIWVLNNLTIASSITGNGITLQAANAVLLENGTTISSGNVVDIKCAPYDPNVDCSKLKSAPVPVAYTLDTATINNQFNTKMTAKVNELAVVADSIRQAHAYIPINASYLQSSPLKSAKVSQAGESNAPALPNAKVDASANTNSDKVSVYPNPASDEINIMVSLPKDDNVKVGLFDMSGRLLKQWNNTYPQGYQKMNISLSQIGKGIYNLKVETSSYIVNQKVIIQRN